MSNQEIVQVSPDLLQPNPLQLRGTITPESINELVESIKEKGILEPLLIAKTPAGYQIVSGERRWRAAKLLGMGTIPVIVKEMKPKDMLETILAESIQTEQLNPLDRARAFRRLKEEFGIAWSEIGKNIGKSTPYIVNTVKLLSLPDALKDGLLSGLITEGHARALSAIGDTRLMIEAYKIVLKEQASVRRAEEIARRVKENLKRLEKEESGLPTSYEFAKSELDVIGQKIAKAFSLEELRVEITQSRVRTTIKFVLEGAPKKTNRFISNLLKRTAKSSEDN